MPQYVLLLHNDDEAWDKLSQPEMIEQVKKYKAWRDRPFVVGGAGLDRNTGRILRRSGAHVVTDEGPLKQSTEAMGGYYTIEAADYNEAVELSMDNPHLGFGTVEIREVMVYDF